MSNKLDDEFFKKNLFEKDKIGAGYFPWRYFGINYYVIVAPFTDCGYYYIDVCNEETKETIHFEKKKALGNFLTKDDLHRCIKFMNVADEFDYE